MTDSSSFPVKSEIIFTRNEEDAAPSQREDLLVRMQGQLNAAANDKVALYRKKRAVHARYHELIRPLRVKMALWYLVSFLIPLLPALGAMLLVYSSASATMNAVLAVTAVAYFVVWFPTVSLTAALIAEKIARPVKDQVFAELGMRYEDAWWTESEAALAEADVDGTHDYKSALLGVISDDADSSVRDILSSSVNDAYDVYDYIKLNPEVTGPWSEQLGDSILNSIIAGSVMQEINEYLASRRAGAEQEVVNIQLRQDYDSLREFVFAHARAMSLLYGTILHTKSESVLESQSLLLAQKQSLEILDHGLVSAREAAERRLVGGAGWASAH